MKILDPVKRLFGTKYGQNILKFLINKFLKQGPDEAMRTRQRTQFWGEAENRSGEKVTITISAQNVYSLTSEAGIRIAAYCLKISSLGGYYTPSMLLTSDFISTLSEVNVEVQQ